MSVPKPSEIPAFKAHNEAPPESKKDVKKPFVRKEHLTQRPFNNPGLHQLRKSLTNNTKQRKGR